MNRRFGKPPDPTRRYTPRAGVYAIIHCGDGLLATFQERPRPEFQLPGGGIDPGESAIAALHREVMEETGHRICAPLRMGMFHRFTYMPEYDLWAQKQCHVYLARLGLRIGPPSEPGHWPVFLPWAEAAERLAVSGDRHFVAQAMARLS
ncbi:NUDIX domain-containing protein [Rhodophyticola porphyridii]|uniref:NUDIX domain-containing protein n=1 Tax=Rhodophyticola porphyridii TaxID=1852017 RepID=A0A3L9YIV1_9RHOB|nr:NUDIX hydrolase [Rhodophyticola porphyridii]RMA42730.1 NUDIX domain-containing protein [Rhodophyticola porphyridii]